MSGPIQYLIDALSVGSTYALLALGLTLVFSVMNLINFAYGILLVWSAYVAYFLIQHDVPFGLAVLGCVLSITLLSMAMGRFAFRPFINAPPITLLITSFGVLQVIQYVAIVAFGEGPKILQLPEYFGSVINLGDIRMPTLQVITIATAVVVVLIYYAILSRTPLGAQIRAAAEMPDVARLMGVKPDRVLMYVFAISGAIAAIVGVLWFAKSGAITPRADLDPTLKAFIAIVLGGLGSTRGALIGGLALGALEVAMNIVLPNSALVFQPAIVFALVIVILILRPGGLAGMRMEMSR